MIVVFSAVLGKCRGKLEFMEEEVRRQAESLTGRPRCMGNPQGFHVALGDGTCCVYCGNKTTNGLLHTSFGKDCKNSPTGLHCLQ